MSGSEDVEALARRAISEHLPPHQAERQAAREECDVLLQEFVRAAEQSISEYDALGDNGPVMLGIDRWTRAALALFKARAAHSPENRNGGEGWLTRRSRSF